MIQSIKQISNVFAPNKQSFVCNNVQFTGHIHEICIVSNKLKNGKIVSEKNVMTNVVIASSLNII